MLRCFYIFYRTLPAGCRVLRALSPIESKGSRSPGQPTKKEFGGAGISSLPPSAKSKGTSGSGAVVKGPGDRRSSSSSTQRTNSSIRKRNSLSSCEEDSGGSGGGDDGDTEATERSPPLAECESTTSETQATSSPATDAGTFTRKLKKIRSSARQASKVKASPKARRKTKGKGS